MSDLIGQFAELAGNTDPREIKRQMGEVFGTQVRNSLDRMDAAVKYAELRSSLATANECRLKRREMMDVLSPLGSLWMNGYWAARCVYGTALTRHVYSRSQDEVEANSELLLEFADSTDSTRIFEALPFAMNDVLTTIANEPDFRVFHRRMGRQVAQACLAPTWAYGVATAIEENAHFIAVV